MNVIHHLVLFLSQSAPDPQPQNHVRQSCTPSSILAAHWLGISQITQTRRFIDMSQAWDESHLMRWDSPPPVLRHIGL